MKSALTTLLLIGFVGTVIFGFISMSHKNDTNHNCIAATAQSADCPKASNSLSFAVFHLDAFKNFSTAVFGNSVLSAFLFFVYLVLLAGFVGLKPPQPNLFFQRRQSFESFSLPQGKRTRWLALHENSPTAA
ncbi:MAG: hypothetical protein HYT21_00070 [Candidatus Nealsonbacteria bacterium]|nr:hypothetical protein [Candidatus Nealsonbacteria bacterium]